MTNKCAIKKATRPMVMSEAIPNQLGSEKNVAHTKTPVVNTPTATV
ncbi:hypothetical protein [Corynebacterium pseudodiphtheriticum]|nr:hypothetical protein [Corynebacterium pseudodiphtheriticum]MDK8552543.1 hypothetical protein [Corynebacterium pseudodiphtheriticum]MDK8563748.1 hypothetical protein [Corynebacterium pseudodiphtheriticum]